MLIVLVTVRHRVGCSPRVVAFLAHTGVIGLSTYATNLL